MNAYLVRALNGQYTDIFKKQGFVAIGWFGETQAENYASWESIAATYKRVFPSDNPNRRGQNIGQIFRFWNQIQPGDIVISSYADGRLIIGKAKDRPYFRKDELCPFFERINVDWLPDVFDRYVLPYPVQASLRSSLTVFQVSQTAEIAALAGYGPPVHKHSNGTDAASVKNAIHKRLLELDDREFEIFVSYLFRQLGFDFEQDRGGTGDKGVDLIGRLDVGGLTSIALHVQVKRYANTTVKEVDIRNLRGTAKDGYQLTFVTLSSFDKKARESASEPLRKPVTLVNGDNLINLFSENFEAVMALIEKAKEEEGDTGMAAGILSKLQFKRIIVPL